MILRAVARAVLAILMVAIGIAHFAVPAGFVAIVPRALPEPLLLVQISGAFEILLGLGLLAPQAWGIGNPPKVTIRRLAGFGLVLLYVAVFPANINMAVNEIQPEGAHIPPILLWARLPFQILFIMWALWCSKIPRPEAASEARA